MSWIDIYKNEDKIIQTYNDRKSMKLKQPPGFTDSVFDDIDNGLFKPIKKDEINEEKIKKNMNKIQNHELKDFKKKKMWELATSPAKSILMNIGMSYMSPNDIQVIPIMMLFMLFINTFKEMYSVSSKFKSLDKSIDSEIDPYDLIIMKIVYLLSCSGNLIIGLWKLNSMGLVPNKSSDWLSWEKPLKSSEIFI
ncbi:hypothetical protein C6P40_000465 [Pichia californica]|uniref:ER membrane protein complex subunit 4 n=1 Tax=Pichia californica TaxID=460514 RepID=A0A9P6WR35_9ASCO|nr:hypothetical protein C6P42_001856 [[Candida] californica]KAG0690967.1 hypothetical protein C6P40_000465 [[Candida] californica]